MSDQLPFTRPSIDEQEIAAIAQVLRSGWVTSGPQVLEFEAALSRYLGGRPVRALNHATAAMELALRVCGIGPGDEVIVPAMSFVASANVVVRVGARPVFVDVGLDTRNIDLEEAEAAITPRTRAILPVHFAGLPVDMDRLYAIAKRHGLRVIEDAAHAIGATWRGRPIGSFGDLVCLSFHVNKNMTTIEGGAISGGSAAEVDAIERLRFHGLKKLAADQFEVLEASGKSNLADVNASLGISQLARLPQFNEKRRALAERYFEHWAASAPVRLPARGDGGHCWHLFAPLLPVDSGRVSRAAFIKQMASRGIAVGLHYPAIHLFAAYRALGYRDGQFVNAERIGRETVTLPLFPAMSTSDVDRVVEATNESIEAARE
ncbi:MAG: DegT/DnrJ/EryC1/StrS aminotransferase family protein [Gammaproteobacteria bacterium]